MIPYQSVVHRGPHAEYVLTHLQIGCRHHTVTLKLPGVLPEDKQFSGLTTMHLQIQEICQRHWTLICSPRPGFASGPVMCSVPAAVGAPPSPLPALAPGEHRLGACRRPPAWPARRASAGLCSFPSASLQAPGSPRRGSRPVFQVNREYLRAGTSPVGAEHGCSPRLSRGTKRSPRSWLHERWRNRRQLLGETPRTTEGLSLGSPR